MNAIAVLAALLLALPVHAAKKKRCGPANLAGKWSGPFSCKSNNPLRATAEGRIDARVEKEDELYYANYAITERINNGKGKSTTTGRSAFVPQPGKKNVYRVSMKLAPNNILRIKSVSALLEFTTEAKSGCAVKHEADLRAALGPLGALASITGRTEVEKKKLSFSSKTASPILNEQCSGRLVPVEDEE